jgi:hypothetical protein
LFVIFILKQFIHEIITIIGWKFWIIIMTKVVMIINDNDEDADDDDLNYKFD